MIFADRYDAGKHLASEIKKKGYSTPYVIGLARGGLPVAFEVAKALKSPLSVLVVRKLGVPALAELGFGAIAPSGIMVLNEEIVRIAGLSKYEINLARQKEQAELSRRIKRYGAKPEMPEIKDKIAILVDDGIATGISAQAAIKYLKVFNPKKVVLATPVCSPETLQMLKAEADEVICLNSPAYFSAVGEWYKDFSQTSDEEVIELLEKAQ
jgi:putative phosphoribosyl transferase